MIRNLAISLAALLVLVAPPLASAHSVQPVSDLLPPGFEAAPGTTPRPVQSAESVDASGGYRLRFTCVPIEVGGPDPQPEVDEPECPVRLRDPFDIMGSPILLVDPRHPEYMAFNAMHGGVGIQPLGKEPPTNQSRDNFLHQPHTTWYSPDGGLQYWNDNPYYSPLQLPPNRQNAESPTAFYPTTQLSGKQVYGEDNAATIDAQGRPYLASLYAYRNVSESTPYQYGIGLWKSPSRVNQPVDYYQGVKVLKLGKDVKADSIHAVYVPHVDRVVVLWRETDGDRSYVNFTYTIPGKGAIWYPSKENQRIGTCSGITNPLAYQGLVYFGCFADKGYKFNNATLGRLQIHSLDARQDSFIVRYVDETTVDAAARGSNAVLFDRTRGNMGIATAGVSNLGVPFLSIAYGYLGASWDSPDKYASELTKLILRPPSPAYEVVEARVNAASFILRSGNVHVIYQERYKPTDEQATAPQTNVAEFYKGLVSIHSAGEREVNALIPLLAHNRNPSQPADSDGVDSPCQVFDARYQGPTQDVFRDLHDSLVVWATREDNQREFIAFADCGDVRFAEIREENFLLFSLPVPPGTPPIPAPLTAANPALTGVAAGALAGAMVLRMLAFKRKLAVEAPA